LMTVAIDSSYDTLYETLLPTTKHLINKRLIKAKETLLISTSVVFIMVLIVWYFSTGIYLATISSIRAISAFTTSFSKGNFSKRVELNANSDFSAIGRSFNSMADNIASLIEAEKQGAARIRAIIDSSQDAVIQMSINGDVIGWNYQAETIFGWSSSEILGKKLHDYIIPFRYRGRHIKGLQHFLETGKTRALNALVEIEALHSDGHEFPIELTVSPIKVENGYEFNAFIRDITERKRTEDDLKLSSLVFGEAHEGIIITDPAGIIIDVNPSVSFISGYSREEIIGNNPSLFSSGKQSQEFYAQMWADVNNTGNWHGEVWNRKKNGELYAELLNISSIQDDEGKVLHYVGMFSDITENKQHQDTLLQLAHYDVLTQLPNRTLFADRFSQAIAHSKRTSTQLAVCFLDLDDFKPVNDNYGHEIGDELLIIVSERIKSVIREEDTVSRQGGDEFALLLGGIGAVEQCEKMMTRLHYALSQPYFINGLTIAIGASSGFTLYPLDNADLDTLLRHADQAMYQAKLEGKNRYHLFNAEQDKEVIQKIDRLNEIEQALRDDQLCMYYQPKVNMKTGKVFGVEALIRWLHPEKGLIPPMEFLPILEGTDLDITLGNWVIEQALMQLDSWKKQGIELEVSINISSHHLQSALFFTVLNDTLEKYADVSSQYLQLEILESSALGDVKAISQLIKTCQDELGICVALDDFGTGYSSLTHMRNLSAQTIKIDQSFVRDILDDPNDYAIIDGIIGLAESFNREVIAEGVETTSHGVMLLLMGCEEAQGYGIARPMPAMELPTWLKSYIPNQEWLINGQKELTVQEQNINLLTLTSQYWLEGIKKKLAFLQGTGDVCSIERVKKTHLKAWRRRLRKEALFSDEWLDSLGQKHEEMEAIGNELIDKYEYKNTDVATQKMEELQQAYEKVSSLLVNFK
ncbi:MAG: EAL domain-containing protein, partial [Methylophaga sp.]|nr:EAL domain-containing protein [Methylophaga sp.]